MSRLHSMDGLLGRALNRHFKQRGFVETKLISEWDRIVGSELAGRCYPVKMSSTRRNSPGEHLLTVEVSDSAAAVEMTYLEPVILEKIATYFGFKAIANIRTVHRPSVPKLEEEPVRVKPLTKEAQEQLDSLVSEVDDEALRRSLAALGTTVWQNKN